MAVKTGFTVLIYVSIEAYSEDTDLTAKGANNVDSDQTAVHTVC